MQYATDLTAGDWPRGWALDRASAIELDARLAVRAPRVVVEAGSGYSTLVLARYAAATGATVVSLEHQEEFATRTRGLLREHGLERYVDVRHAPLKPTDRGPWYDAQLPDGVEFALVDGPPKRSGGRAASLPQLWPHLAEDWEIWLDDSLRPGEAGAINAWRSEYPIAAEQMGHGHGMARITPATAGRGGVLFPKIIHVVWVGPKPFPYARYLTTWETHNPDWEVWFWTNENRPRLRNEQVYRKVPHYSGKVNILRLELLHRYGGLYSDADSECLKPLEPLVAGHRSLSMTGRHGGAQNGTLAACPGDATYERMIADIPARYKALRNSDRNRTKGISILSVFGTRYITPYLRQDPGFHQVDGGKKFGGRRLICERPEQCEDTYIVHDQTNSWRENTIKRKTKVRL